MLLLQLNKKEKQMNQYLMLATGLIAEVARATRHPYSLIVATVMLAITIFSMQLPYLASENVLLVLVALTLEYQ